MSVLSCFAVAALLAGVGLSMRSVEASEYRNPEYTELLQDPDTDWNNSSFDPVTPGSWICYSTARSIEDQGGHINKSKCEDVNSDNRSVWIGWVGVVIAILFFGSNFIPVKKFDTGNGMFFQWVLCIGIWMVGLVTNMARYQPPFFFPSILGGFLWTTGNLMVVPVIKTIGLTMGLTVWGLTNMLTGWFTGVVILREKVPCAPLNYGGVAVVVISVVVLAFVKSEGKTVKKEKRQRWRAAGSENTGLLSEQPNSLEGSLREKMLQREGKVSSIQHSSDEKLTFGHPPQNARNGRTEWEDDYDSSWTDHLGVWPKRIVGFSLALFSGLFYGLQFLTVEFMKSCEDMAHSCNDTDYLFGHFCGIFVASTFYFVIYSIAARNRPRIYPRVILPGLVSGIMWGIAMVGWFLANQHLSLAVSFPIITAGPGFVSSAWGILLFREIKGWRNIILYFVALGISLSGQIMDGLSHSTVVPCHI